MKLQPSSGNPTNSRRLTVYRQLSLPTGETAEILLHGATVISWKIGGEEKLWLSEKAVLGWYPSSTIHMYRLTRPRR